MIEKIRALLFNDNADYVEFEFGEEKFLNVFGEIFPDPDKFISENTEARVYIETPLSQRWLSVPLKKLCPVLEKAGVEFVPGFFSKLEDFPLSPADKALYARIRREDTTFPDFYEEFFLEECC